MIPVPEHILQCFGQFSCVKAVYEGSLQKLVPYWAQFTLSVQDEVDPGPSKVMIKTVWLHTDKQWVNMYINEQYGSLEDEKLYRLMRKCMCIKMKRHRDTTNLTNQTFSFHCIRIVSCFAIDDSDEKKWIHTTHTCWTQIAIFWTLLLCKSSISRVCTNCRSKWSTIWFVRAGAC